MSNPVHATTAGATGAREAARRDNGQFGTQPKSEASGVDLFTPPPVEIPDGDGVGYLVTPGVIDGGSESVYCSGAQSLALARLLSERTGWPVIVTTRTGPDPLLDEEDWDDAEKYDVLYEAHVEHPDGYLICINGRQEKYAASGSEFVDAWEYRRERITSAQILDELDDLCEQDPDESMAATFVTPVLAANNHHSAPEAHRGDR
ncbi:hypothetical protein [Nocardioides sp. InS609-2]|uniref:hypothetical protein n=1 Tax=Nocardioides sp. InS609-2 TaxID=2760705 RepID=UPI0020C0E13B|nr:hypothetical protein [Nocardioides sp. InS609-2]